MHDYTPREVIDTLRSASNLNAAVKKCLKREVQRGTPAEKFLKQLKNDLAGERWEAAETFLQKHLKTQTATLLLLAHYAHLGLVNEISDKVVDTYAEKFNASYERTPSGIKIRDRKTFQQIAKEVNLLLEKELTERALPPSLFIKQVINSSIFEDSVLEEIMLLTNGTSTALKKN